MVGCISIIMIMTIFPPQIIEDYFVYGDTRTLQSEQIEYKFIGGGDLDRDEKASIAFDRLFLQYFVVIGAGFITYLLKKED
ncbi:hypothetical protein SAMN06265218_1412 [Fodinibius sediminis]|uniref:Uncharacterized protein n=2 Tax=Fodinibius sediminis TaxID=1214077 RepID=A0A521FIH5_9BACT|nr:hypothetical protein SAMN06265218_1412 [Fodinibius sediminis]